MSAPFCYRKTKRYFLKGRNALSIERTEEMTVNPLK